MYIAVFLILEAFFVYLLLRASASQKDWAQEDQEQAEYLRAYALRRQEKKRERRGG